MNHANIFDNTDMSLSPIDNGVMNYARWYPTMVSLPSGQVVIIGGSDGDHRELPLLKSTLAEKAGAHWTAQPAEISHPPISGHG